MHVSQTITCRQQVSVAGRRHHHVENVVAARVREFDDVLRQIASLLQIFELQTEVE